MGLINDNLRFLRNRQKLSQQKLADRIGVNRSNIDSYERNSTPPLEVLDTIANTFGINLQMMIAERMTEYNFDQFLINGNHQESQVNEPVGRYGQFKKQNFYNLMVKIRNTDEKGSRALLVDQAIEMVNLLEDEKSAIHHELFDLIKELRKL